MKIVVGAITALLAAASVPADCPAVSGVLPYAPTFVASNGCIRLTALQEEKAGVGIQVFFYPEKDDPQGKLVLTTDKQGMVLVVCGICDELRILQASGGIRNRA